MFTRAGAISERERGLEGKASQNSVIEMEK